MEDQKYDFVLITDFFRTATFFLCVINELASKFRLAVYISPVELSSIKKNESGQRRFLEACSKLGADIFTNGEELETVLALVAQRPYSEEALTTIKNNIKSDLFVGALTLAWPGMHDQFIMALDITVVFVIDRRFMNFLLRVRQSSLYDSLSQVEVGLPFGKYQLLKDFAVDYMLAIPTAFSFAHEKDKWSFLETILSLYQQMEPSDTVVVKAHNGLEWDGFSSHRCNFFVRAFGWIPGSGAVFKWLACSRFKYIGKFWGKIYTAFLYKRVLSRTLDLSSLCNWHHFGIELFYPYIHKGVIGGLSNTQWGALYFRLPFYNCINDLNLNRKSDDVLYGSDKAVHNVLLLNMKHFGVQFCRGRLVFDESQFEIISEQTRQGDLVEALVAEYNKLLHTVSMSLGESERMPQEFSGNSQCTNK